MRSGLLRKGAVIGLLLAAGVSTPASLRAQDTLNCDSFGSQAEAQEHLNGAYPDDPDRLDADHDWVACENYFELSDAEEARVIPSNVVNGGANSANQEPGNADNGIQSQGQDQMQDQPPPQDQPTPAPVEPAPAPETLAPVAAPGPGVSSRVDPPADLLAQVADCEVVTVSTRSIAGAGCPGRGVVILHPPAGAPRMRSSVTIRPGAMFADTPRVATAAQEAVVNGAEERGRQRQRNPSVKVKSKDRAGHANAKAKKQRRAHREQRGARD